MGGMILASKVAGDPFTVTAEKIHLYAQLTNDFNPIHLDPEFAAQTSMKGVIAHGTMSLALIWRLLRSEYGSERVAGAKLDVRFTKPVRIGDVLMARIESDDEDEMKVWVENQHGDQVIMGKVAL